MCYTSQKQGLTRGREYQKQLFNIQLIKILKETLTPHNFCNC